MTDRLSFDPYGLACKLLAGAANAIKKKERPVGGGRSCGHTKGLSLTAFVRAPWLASWRDRCVSWNEGTKGATADAAADITGFCYTKSWAFYSFVQSVALAKFARARRKRFRDNIMNRASLVRGNVSKVFIVVFVI